MEKTTLRENWRRADAESSEAPVEVTPAMIEAGARWLDLYDGDSSDSAKFLTNIFRAMYMAQVVATKDVEVVA